MYNVHHAAVISHPVTKLLTSVIAVCDQPTSAEGFVLHAIYENGEDITDLTDAVTVTDDMTLTEFLESALCNLVYGEP